MANYSTLLTVFGQDEPTLAALETVIRPHTLLLERIDNVFFMRTSSNRRFWDIADSLTAQNLSFIYYFVLDNNGAEVAYDQVPDELATEIATILSPNNH